MTLHDLARACRLQDPNVVDDFAVSCDGDHRLLGQLLVVVTSDSACEDNRIFAGGDLQIMQCRNAVVDKPRCSGLPSIICRDVLCVVIDTIDRLSRGELRRKRQGKSLESVETNKLAALSQFFRSRNM